ncbi:hypothetical protein CkaCkLH20_11879 [Colletotrichum karsti]|uniref:RNA helicase n=1 Tax=Colletotrichum karsti TaxID=1095194 RepID=A0A9P6HTW1_9PEZI|nr:uncharacterized protein CkaCkLH20_11879 [Colletotrichum karsti]KAF9870573.1 hypothetical protein CkaCkLH20_11879 [Colletotrichum karsti]
MTSVPFTGQAAECEPLSPRFVWQPEASLLHSDGGNSGSQDFPGPRGVKTHTSAKAQPAFVFLWGQDNQLTSGYINATTLRYGLVALNPDSLDVLAAWYPEEDNQALNIPYMELIVKTNDILVSSAQGMIWVVQRGTFQGRPYFKTTRTVDLRPQLQEDDQLLNAMFDNENNIWFTTGALQLDTSANGTLANSTKYGYITPSNEVHKAQLDGETVENGIAVAGTNVYMVTSPSGKSNTPNAPGYMYSLTAKSGSEGGITTRWRVPYAAGERTGLDPNTAISARGSGATPALLVDKYVAIADNDTPRLHLNVYHQAPQADSSSQLLCQVPLFTDNKGSVQNSVLAHYDTQQKQYGIMILNSYGGPTFFTSQNGQELNGKFNDMSGMAGGITRVDVDEHGNCSVRWSKDTKSKGVSVLSTNNGLVYHYVQDDQRAMMDDEYVWYLMGRSWATGEERFKVRAGSGGAFNDNWNDFTESKYNKTVSFDDMNLRPELLRGVYAYGFERPSSIQQCAIMPIINGQDVIAEATYGSGRTAALVIPILQKLRADLEACQALILVPTRESALQIQKFILAIGDFMNIRCSACVGGVGAQDYEKVFRDETPQVVVGTPGRLRDVIQRNILETANIERIALDDADEIFARGFEDQIYDIPRLLSQPIQVVVSTVTMPQDLLEATSTLMRNPHHIYVKKKGFRLEGIKQFYVNVENDERKLDTYLDIYASVTTSVQTITFCNTRKRTEWLAEKLGVLDIVPFAAMHGDMPATERAEIMAGFRSGSTRSLLATELLARGIDVQQVPLVINYDLHADHETYKHRVGRGGRFGRNGVVVNLVTPENISLVRKIEDFYNAEMEETTVDNLKSYLMKQEWAQT